MSIPNILGENFKKAREAQGLSVAELASKAVLSRNQIEQIENGKNKSFYTAAIKVQSAKKVAKLLGLTEEEAFEKRITNDSQQIPLEFPETARSLACEDIKTELVEKSQEKDTIASPAQTEPEKSSKIKKQMRSDLEKVSSTDTHVKEVIATVQTDVDQVRQKIVSFPKLFVYVGSAITLIFVVTYYNSQSKEANSNHVTASEPPIKTSEPNQAQDIKNISPAGVITATPAEANISIEASKVSAKANTTISECAGLFSNLEKYTPTIASKIGNQVYVQSKVEGTICFEDADGNQQKRDLAQNTGVSFYGKPPFKLGSTNLEQFHIFYQGYKVKADLSKKAVILNERTVVQNDITSNYGD